MKKALQLIPAKSELLAVEGAGHDLGFKGKNQNKKLLGEIFAAFETSLADRNPSPNPAFDFSGGASGTHIR